MSAVPKDELSGNSGAVLRGGVVRIAPEPAQIQIPGDPATQPVVSLVRAGDIVQAIDIKCTCGKRIRLKCVYGPESGP